MIPLKIFMCGVKRDASNFPKFQDEKQWNEWYNKTKAQARSQFANEILDVNYTSQLIILTYLT